MVKGRLNQLVARCVLNTPLEPLKGVFESMKLVRLYKKRWFVAVLFLRAVLPVFGLLERCWDQGAFGNGPSNDEGNADDGFNPQHVTDVVRSPLWHVYA
eukprot:15018212-Alexandrium_andersonii.AAC.1